MKKSNSRCSVCGKALTTPFEKSRGKHDDCTQKDGSESMQK